MLSSRDTNDLDRFKNTYKYIGQCDVVSILDKTESNEILV